MAVPFRLLPVDGQIYIHALVLRPLVLNLIQANQIFLRAGTVKDIYSTVIFTVVHHIVDDGTKRCQADASRYKQKILSL